MQPRSLMEVTTNDLELWTLDDAETWKEAEVCPIPEGWADDPLLDNDLWMENTDCGSLSIEALGQLGIRVA